MRRQVGGKRSAGDATQGTAITQIERTQVPAPIGTEGINTLTGDLDAL
jgi:hypothetical protein